MRDREFYAEILGMSPPRHVTAVVLDLSGDTVGMFVEHRGQVVRLPGLHPRVMPLSCQ